VGTLDSTRPSSSECGACCIPWVFARHTLQSWIFVAFGRAGWYTESADARIQDFTFTQTKGDLVQWKVQAEQARLFEKESRAILNNVQITMYGAQGKELTLSGDEGTLDTQTKNFQLSNRTTPIVVETQSGYTIQTNHLVWTDARHEIQTPDHVTINGHGLQVTGRGLLGKMDTEEFQVLDDVRVDVVPAS
jgi:LPS export ABC transporter protein LptC